MRAHPARVFLAGTIWSLLIGTPCWAQSAPNKAVPDPEFERTCQKAIADLRSDSFEVREAAETKLNSVVKKAEALLRKALKDTADPESRMRINRILELLIEDPVLVFETTLGRFEVKLFGKKAPVTTKNFLRYVNEKFYDGTLFHRVIDNFMIQGGGYDKDETLKKAKAPIKNESDNGLTNVKYSLAMARTQDLDSATCQFFINVKDNPFLDRGRYCVFGRVVKGQEIIDKIKAADVDKPGRLSEAQPKEPIVMLKVHVKSKTDK